ncbi:MAG: GNAT family N-acetyltransferase [Ktedonobacteraceae bacterium]
MMKERHLPTLPGITFRSGRGAEDADPYVTVMEACRHVDQIDPFSTLESIPTVEEMAEYLAKLDPQNILVATAHEHMIAFVRVRWWEEGDGTWLYLHVGRVLPEWRGRGLGTALVHWAEQRLRTLATGHPTHGKGTFGANASSTETPATELLLNEGYTVYYTSAQMEWTDFAHLQTPGLPECFALRSAIPEQYRLIWEAARRHWAGFTKANNVPTEEDYQEFLSLISPDPELLKVVWHNEQPIAIVQGSIAHGIGIIDDVIVSSAYKRRGLAEALLTYEMITMRARGVQRIRLHTDASNRHGARSLYEKLGFGVIKTFPRYRKPMGG